MFSRVKVGAGVLFLLAAVAAAGCVRAEPLSLKDFLFGQRQEGVSLPAVARYQVEGGPGFVLDRSAGRHATLKFEDSPEIWALSAAPGPRGDVIYRDDLGEPVLRATRLGGMTLFTNADPGGAAAAELGVAPSLRAPPVLGPEALFQVLLQAAGRASRAAQHLIVFDAGDANVSPASESVFADAFILTADAIVRVSARGPGGHAACAHLAKVRFVQGPDAAAAMMSGHVVLITVAPDQGIAGRPSSRRIAALIASR